MGFIKLKTIVKKYLLLAGLSAAILRPGGLLAEPAGFTFLKVGVGAAAQGMGKAFIAQTKDASAAYWNPAALGGLEAKEIFLYQNRFISDFSYTYFAYAHPLKRIHSSFAVSLGRYAKGGIDGRDDSGQKTGDFSAEDSFAALSLGKKFGETFFFGTTAKVIRSGIQDYTAQGFALDVSASKELKTRTMVSVGVFNVGPAVNYADRSVALPSTAELGASHSFSALTLAGNFRYGLKDQTASLSMGGQIQFFTAFSIRAGYLSQMAKNTVKNGIDAGKLNSLSGLAMGFGMKFMRHGSADYAFVPMGELGTTHHISLSWRFL